MLKLRIFSFLLLGRAREILFFEEEFKNLSEDCDREPGTIFITGSGGIGKSKLLSVVKARATLMDIRYLVNRVTFAI